MNIVFIFGMFTWPLHLNPLPFYGWSVQGMQRKFKVNHPCLCWLLSALEFLKGKPGNLQVWDSMQDCTVTLMMLQSLDSFSLWLNKYTRLAFGFAPSVYTHPDIMLFSPYLGKGATIHPKRKFFCRKNRGRCFSFRRCNSTLWVSALQAKQDRWNSELKDFDRQKRKVRCSKPVDRTGKSFLKNWLDMIGHLFFLNDSQKELA